jgi:hypothetical protein
VEEADKRLFEELAHKYSEKISKFSAEIYTEITEEMGDPYSAQTALINAFSIAYARCVAVYCYRHVGGDLQDLSNKVYTDFQFLVKDLLAKHSGKMSFAIRIDPKEGEKKEENSG